MLKKDYTAELLNLEDVIITDVKNISEELHIYLHLPRGEHTCPCCGGTTNRIHDYREQLVKDIPTTYLHLRKRRYICSCGKRFAEENSFLPPVLPHDKQTHRYNHSRLSQGDICLGDCLPL